ncbi:MAG: multidrug MFS transporter [Candidatus Rokuibacteriota bacterium]|nr:MAG: multidrug MFS transporter [Candidatus Rokubacteria bacterium]
MTSAPQQGSNQSADKNAIRPFHVNVPEAELTELRRRIAATRWPEKETVSDTSQGVPLAALQDLARYWATDYDWRRCEARLNALPQFTTEIDGLDIHFIHVRSKHKGALPVIVTHGWPGSILEQIKLVGPLTDPTAFGGRAEDAFDVVIPSIPGYGFSGKPTATGWDPVHIARAWIVLMRRLGYTRYVAQGGDVGGLITDAMAVEAPAELVAMHTNFLFALPEDVSNAIQSGGPAPSDLSDLERRALDKLKGFFAKNASYAFEMATRPQTLYGLADSPVGLAAWLIDHGDGDDQPAATVRVAMRTPTKGQPPERLTRDDVLDNITLYWLTNTGISSARSYWENKTSWFGPKNVSIPVAVTVFPGEVYQPSRRWAERGYRKLMYFHEADKGGHFAAWEEPLLFASEMRAGFRSLRK